MSQFGIGPRGEILQKKCALFIYIFYQHHVLFNECELFLSESLSESTTVVVRAKKRNGVPGDTARCTLFQIGSVMWLGWTVMRLILIVDDTYPETWTITNGGVSGMVANGTVDQLKDAMYSFDQMKQWQIKEEKMDAMYVSCVKYKYGNYFTGTSASMDDLVNATKEHPVASIIGTRKLKIDDSPRLSAVGICAANCKVNQMGWWIVCM